MSEAQKQFYTITFTLSLFGASLTLLSDFAGWTEATFFGTNDYYVFVGSENVPAFATPYLILLTLLHAISSYLSYNGIRGNDQIRTGLMVNLGAFSLTLVGLALLAVLAADTVEWWPETGFYASLIASGVGSYLFWKLNESSVSK